MEPSIECRDLFSRLGDDEILVLDCRTIDDWQAFELQIPGALAMSNQELGRAADALPDDELIVVCGCSTDGQDARRAFRLLRLRGRRAVILEGGLRAWVTQGYPTEHRMWRGGNTSTRPAFAAAKSG